jgi:hypothetical protein
MKGICNTVTAKVLELLQVVDNGTLQLNRLASTEGAKTVLSAQSIAVINSSPELVEKTARAKYPSVSIYCDKFTNSLHEKFRAVSGTVHVTVEVRHSQDRLEHMEMGVQSFADAVCAVLDDSRGDWGGGTFYGGGYEATFAPVKAGGLGYLQVCKIGFEVEASR